MTHWGGGGLQGHVGRKEGKKEERINIIGNNEDESEMEDKIRKTSDCG